MKSRKKNMNFPAGRLTAALLSFCLLLSGCATVDGKTPSASFTSSVSSSAIRVELPKRETVPADLDYADMPFVRADEDALFARASTLTARVKAATDISDAEDILLQYDELLQHHLHLLTLQALAQIASDRDVTDNAAVADEAWALAASQGLAERLVELTQAILSSPLAESARLTWGDEYIERFRFTQALTSPEILPLLQEQAQLEAESDRLLAKETVFQNDREYTRSDLGYPEFARLRAEERGEVYLRLLALRNRIADTLGFDCYAEYSYALYGRAYSPADTAAFASLVKELLVPLYRELDAGLSHAGLPDNLPNPEQILDLLEQIAPELGGGFSESLSRIRRQSLSDLADGANKSASIYTICLSDYRLPYIMMNPAGDYTDVSSLIHEIGHFNSALRAPSTGFNQPFSYDTAEFHSQGLEMLMLPYYPALFEEQAELAGQLRLRALLRNILSGCMEDEFQQYAYSLAEPSVGLLNAEYERLQAEYFGGGKGNLWVIIPHTFYSPFYYMSYAVSAAAALELWELSRRDWEAAVQCYNAACEKGTAADFPTALRDGNLSDPMTRDSLSAAAEGVRLFLTGGNSGH